MIDFYKNCKSFSIYNVNTSKALSVSSRKRIVISSAFGYFRDGKYHISNEINFIFDTGAVDVSFPAYLLGIENEQELFSKFDSVKAVYRSGINKAAPIKYYRIYADVYISNSRYKLREVPIYVSFDPNCFMALFGMSILGLFKIEIDPISTVVTLTETPALLNIREQNLSLRDPFSVDYYAPLDFADDIDEATLEANYVNKQLNPLHNHVII